MDNPGWLVALVAAAVMLAGVAACVTFLAVWTIAARALGQPGSVLGWLPGIWLAYFPARLISGPLWPAAFVAAALLVLGLRLLAEWLARPIPAPRQDVASMPRLPIEWPE